MPRQFTIGKEERLKSRKLIERIFETGKKFSEGSFRVFYVIEKNNRPVLQFGAGVSGKVFKKATDRNRIKRLTREAWRLQKNDLQKTAGNNQQSVYVFVIFTKNEIPDYRDVYGMINKILLKLIKNTGDNS